MPALEKTLRNQLERAVENAREIAEDGAKSALETLGVGDATAPSYLSDDQRNIRRRLRIHGRQLGDLPDEKAKTQQIERLTEEVAYEHWHRMLFARFLAENNLLMYPDPDCPVAVSLAECDDMAADEGASNGWELAARFAASMLPQIFRVDSPVFQITLPPEDQQALERLVAELPAEIFHASDSLGWVYQFWQAKKKDEVNASEVKIGAREISPVTQLFTEPYMVSFLLDNSLGAWWSGQRLSPATLRNAPSEGELKKQASLPGVPLEYLRFVASEDRGWSIAAGTFDGWPRRFNELKILDPCCGSGHFLVATFLMLVPMRMAAENLSASQAVDAVLRENIYGLEIDQRCVELAVFALALAAWTYPDAGGYRPLPTFNVACTGLSISSSLDRWMSILEGQSLQLDLRFYFEQLYNLFSKAPTLGSLINPHRFLGSGLLNDRGMKMLLQALRGVVKHEPWASERYELGVVAEGLARAAELLAERYTLVVTNVPYLGRGKQDDLLKEHIETHYPLGKADLATAFVLRCLEFCAPGGTEALVTPQNWLFLTTYTKLRTMLLEKRQWNVVARLGPGAFETISGHVVNVALPMITASPPEKDHLMAGVDVSSANKPDEKAAMLRGENATPVVMLRQAEQLKNPDSVVTFEVSLIKTRLGEYARSIQGVITGDYDRFGRFIWELNCIDGALWRFQQSTVDSTLMYGGREGAIYWESGAGELAQSDRARVQGLSALGMGSVAIRQMGTLAATIGTGDLHDNNVAAVVPRHRCDLAAVWCFLSDPEFVHLARTVDQELNITNATFGKLPFDLNHWRNVAAEKYPNGLPEPESDDPTQWLFHGRPEESASPLQVAVARLLGYRWPAEHDTEMRLSERARRLVASCELLSSLADDDGIVCIPAVRGEPSAADRLLNLLAASYQPAGVSPRFPPTASPNDPQPDANACRLIPASRDGDSAQHPANPNQPAGVSPRLTSTASPDDPQPDANACRLIPASPDGDSAQHPANPNQPAGVSPRLTSTASPDDAQPDANACRLIPASPDGDSSQHPANPYQPAGVSPRLTPTASPNDPQPDANACRLIPASPDGDSSQHPANPYQPAGVSPRLTPTASPNDPQPDANACRLIPASPDGDSSQHPANPYQPAGVSPRLTPTTSPNDAQPDANACRLIPSASDPAASEAAPRTGWSTDLLNTLLSNAGYAGKSLENWLRDGFFQQHCELFHNRPFIWHIWDGLPDGFAALVNYHKLDRKNLETLTYTYLGDWISRQRQDIAAGIDGAQVRLAAAETLKKRLELILEGEAPYDIFVRWKPLHEQPIGWNPDINDGVRLNIRPFLSVPDVKKKGAGLLRDRPRVDWKKDRGKEPQRSAEDYPWFWGWDEKTTDFPGGDEFKGERFNDCHYTLASKRKARESQK